MEQMNECINIEFDLVLYIPPQLKLHQMQNIIQMHVLKHFLLYDHHNILEPKNKNKQVKQQISENGNK
jgi:hypothetical protein